MGAKGSQGEPQRRPKAAKGSQKAAQRRPRRRPNSSKINLKINEKIGFVFYWFSIRFWSLLGAKIKLKFIKIYMEWKLPAESQDPQKTLKKQGEINDFTDVRSMKLVEN